VLPIDRESKAWRLQENQLSMAGSRSSGDALAHGALLDALFVARALDDPLHEDARRMDVIGIELAGLDELLHFRNRDLARGRHHRIEIACCLAIDQVAFGVALPRLHDGEIRSESRLENVRLAVH